ncbi:MAG TPA: hypothetical protein VHC92_03565 [Rhodanobacteraceae bacterium]|nr:hypothetical protein [Rhodanobacteraceae bacterium]
MKDIRRDTLKIRLRIVAAAAICCVLGIGTASAKCSDKARALGKCPPPTHVQPKMKTSVHGAGATPVTAGQPKTARRNSTLPPGVGPSPVEHSGKNALNPQPIPPGHPIHPLPAPEANGPGGH